MRCVGGSCDVYLEELSRRTEILGQEKWCLFSDESQNLPNANHWTATLSEQVVRCLTGVRAINYTVWVCVCMWNADRTGSRWEAGRRRPGCRSRFNHPTRPTPWAWPAPLYPMLCWNMRFGGIHMVGATKCVWHNASRTYGPQFLVHGLTRGQE